MRSRPPLPAALRERPFSVTAAFDLGLSADRLRKYPLEKPFWGVRSARALTSTRGLAHAYATRMRADQCFSHETAAMLWGIWMPPAVRTIAALDVTAPLGTAAPDGRGIRGHRALIDRSEVVTLDGLPVTSLLRTWLDLGTVWCVEDLIAAGDNITWFRRDDDERVRIESLHNGLKAAAGRPGIRALRAAAPYVCGRADSHPEVRFRVRALDAGLPHPVVNSEIVDDNGRFVAQPDLQWPRYRLSWDYEGEHHGRDGRQWEKDILRVPRLDDAGWEHVRAARSSYANPREHIRYLARKLMKRGWDGVTAG